MLVNRYDRNYEIILRDLKAKVQQVRANICLTWGDLFIFFLPELLNASPSAGTPPNTNPDGRGG